MIFTCKINSQKNRTLKIQFAWAHQKMFYSRFPGLIYLSFCFKIQMVGSKLCKKTEKSIDPSHFGSMILAHFGVGVEDIFLVYFKLFSWIIAGLAHQFMTTVYTWVHSLSLSQLPKSQFQLRIKIVFLFSPIRCRLSLILSLYLTIWSVWGNWQGHHQGGIPKICCPSSVPQCF